MKNKLAKILPPLSWEELEVLQAQRRKVTRSVRLAVPTAREEAALASGAKIIPLTMGKFALVDADDYEMLSKLSWFANMHSNGIHCSARANLNLPDGRRSSVRMQRRILLPFNAPDTIVIDHINHDDLDNRRSNLRITDSSGNNCNFTKKRNCVSQYKGVYRVGNKRWGSGIQFRFQHTYLGSFATELEAALAYDKAARRIHGDFACLNFPDVL